LNDVEEWIEKKKYQGTIRKEEELSGEELSREGR
jgi:hypothetical protein